MSYYEDNISKWYISGGGKHSTFINQIKDFDLTDKIGSIIDARKEDPSFDTRFEYNGKRYSVWVDENPNKNKLYRDDITGTDTPSSDSSNTSTSSVSSNKPKFQSGYFRAGTEEFVPLDEYKRRNKENFSIRRMTPKDISPTWGIFQENGNQIIKVWIGEYIKPNN